MGELLDAAAELYLQACAAGFFESDLPGGDRDCTRPAPLTRFNPWLPSVPCPNIEVSCRGSTAGMCTLVVEPFALGRAMAKELGMTEGSFLIPSLTSF
jgi:hypothetical protein